MGAKVAAIAACALVPTVLWQSISGVLLGVGRVRLWNVIQTLPPVGTFIGMLVLVVGLHGGVRGAVLAWTLAHVFTALFSLTATRGIWMPLPLSRWADWVKLQAKSRKSPVRPERNLEPGILARAAGWPH